MVIESLKVQKEVAQRAKNLLHENECIIGGVILNSVVRVIPSFFYKIS
jgi:hypothetical protein